MDAPPIRTICALYLYTSTFDLIQSLSYAILDLTTTARKLRLSLYPPTITRINSPDQDIQRLQYGRVHS